MCRIDVKDGYGRVHRNAVSSSQLDGADAVVVVVRLDDELRGMTVTQARRFAEAQPRYAECIHLHSPGFVFIDRSCEWLQAVSNGTVVRRRHRVRSQYRLLIDV